MNYILYDIILVGTHRLVYLDDIIKFSTSLQGRIQSLKKIFERLRRSNFKLQLDKCEFMKRETEFLGHNFN